MPAPLIDPESPPPAPLPPDQAFAATMARMLADLRSAMVQRYNGIMAYAWNDPPIMGDTLTPEQRMTALGTKAAALFSAANQLAALIVEADPTTAVRLRQVPTAYYHPTGVVANPDGTVTVTRQSETP